MLEVRNVTFNYSAQGEQDAPPALRNVTLSFREGETVAVLGQNGSGKSTLARLLAAILLPSEGSILVDDMLTTMRGEDLWTIRQRVGLVFQNPDDQLVASTVLDDIAFGPENIGLPRFEIQERVDEAIALLGLEEYREMAISELSVGQKQRVAVAGVLAMRPRYLILDEPTTMISGQTARHLLETVQRLAREQGITVVHITHYMHEAATFDRAIVLDAGRVVMDDIPAAIFARTKDLQTIGLDASMVTRLGQYLSVYGLLQETVLSAEHLRDMMRERAQDASREPGQEIRRERAQEISRESGKDTRREPGQEIREPRQDIRRERAQEIRREPGQDIREPRQDIRRERAQDSRRESGQDSRRERAQDIRREPGQDSRRERAQEIREPGRPQGDAPTIHEIISHRMPLYSRNIPLRVPWFPTSPIFELQNVTYTYLHDTPLEREALHKLSLTIAKGYTTALVGATNAGKSTVLDLLACLLKPTGGSVLFEDENTGSKTFDVERIRANVGVVFQSPESQIFEETVGKDVSFGLRRKQTPLAESRRLVQEALEAVGLSYEDFRLRYTYALSGGQKRRVAIAGVLALQPQVIMLDEPMAGLDPRGRQELLHFIEELKGRDELTIVYASSSLEDVIGIADYIHVLDAGKLVVSGTPREILSSIDTLQALDITLPEATRIALTLRDMFPELRIDILTLEELEEELLMQVEGYFREKV